eukprot:TRINITY_DN757_c0_g1_i1.p1 TRINITY_DN757_c0_g1~~TRINITY_DN757_c0_g1_i1.p1  ORF type:complete len:664 (-),score=222.28 TRINITY_DN757_c0_g1_i1:160-2151(-)
MKFSSAVVSAILLQSSQTSARSLSFDAEDARERPVTKVVNLLKGVSEQLEKEGEEDKKTYDTYKCWCKTNGEEKAAAAVKAAAAIKEHKARVAELTATSSRLEVEYTNLGKDVEKYQAAMEKARAIRKEENGKFVAEETDELKNLDAVNSALQTVKSGSFLQSGSKIRNNLDKLLVLQGDRLSDWQSKVMDSFLQQQNPASDAVAGVLTSLKKDFEATLEQIRGVELKRKTSYEELMKANRDQHDAAKEAIDQKREEKAAADEEIMQRKRAIVELNEAAGGDAEFAAEVKEKCRVFEQEFETRTKTRADESEAVQKAIEVLSNDEAFDTFGKTLPTFLQLEGSATASSSAGVMAKRLELASATLAASGKLDSRLMTLALQTKLAKLDGFYRVKKSIDEMLIALKNEHEDEVKQKDYCVQEFQENKVATEKKTRMQKKQTNKVENLKVSIKKSSEEVASLSADTAEMQKQLKLASQNREAENAEFQQVVQDQRSTQTLLQKALTVLGDFYTKQKSFVQVGHEANPEEPAGFKDYKKSAGSMGAMSLLQQLIADAKAGEVEAVAGERTAQENYESFAKETSTSVATKTEQLDDATEVKAKAEKELVETKESLSGTTDEIMELATVNSDLHVTCDFVMKNFDVRQKARQQEMDALKQAKSYLNGAK